MGQGAGQAPGGAPSPKSEWVLGTGLLQPAHPQTPTGNCQAEVKDCFGFCFHGLESVFFFFTQDHILLPFEMATDSDKGLRGAEPSKSQGTACK